MLLSTYLGHGDWRKEDCEIPLVLQMHGVHF